MRDLARPDIVGNEARLARRENLTSKAVARRHDHSVRLGCSRALEVVKGHSGALLGYPDPSNFEAGGRRYASGDHPECLGGIEQAEEGCAFVIEDGPRLGSGLSRGSRAIESSHEIRFTSSTSCSMLLLQSLPWRTVTRRQCGHLGSSRANPGWTDRGPCCCGGRGVAVPRAPRTEGPWSPVLVRCRPVAVGARSSDRLVKRFRYS